MERKWVVAACLDISGFKKWTYRAAVSPEIKEKFLTDFYGVLQCYVKKHHGPWSKYQGDGIFIVREFHEEQKKDRRSILNFILELRCLLRKTRKIIRNDEMPPDGVRIRIMDGYVYKLMVLDPNDPKRERRIPEYVEYTMNTVKSLLEVNHEIPCLATENLVKNIGKGRSVFRVRPLGTPSSYPKGVNLEDVETLQILRF